MCGVESLIRLLALLLLHRGSAPAVTYEPEASTSAAAPAPGDDVDMADAPADGRPAAAAAADEHREWPLLLRATDGKSNKTSKVKRSTVVRPPSLPPSFPPRPRAQLTLSPSRPRTQVLPEQVDAFLDRYALLLRTEFAAALRPKRKRADLVRARIVRQLTRQAKLRRRKAAAEEPWMASAETIEAEAQRRVKALEARHRAAALGPAAGAGAGAKGKGASAGAAAAGAAPGAGAFRVVLPKVVGPRRGNGVERRRRSEKRRNKVVDKVKRRRDVKLAGSGSLS